MQYNWDICWYIWWNILTNGIFLNSKINRPILNDLNNGIGELDSCYLEIIDSLLVCISNLKALLCFVLEFV